MKHVVALTLLLGMNTLWAMENERDDFIMVYQTWRYVVAKDHPLYDLTYELGKQSYTAWCESKSQPEGADFFVNRHADITGMDKNTNFLWTRVFYAAITDNYAETVAHARTKQRASYEQNFSQRLADAGVVMIDKKTKKKERAPLKSEESEDASLC